MEENKSWKSPKLSKQQFQSVVYGEISFPYSKYWAGQLTAISVLQYIFSEIEVRRDREGGSKLISR